MKIPDLYSGGVMLSYRCSNACRHCLYRCNTVKKNRWLEGQMLEKVFAALAEEPYLSGVHLAGGEATLNMDVLVEALRCARRHGVPVDYLETNCGWAENEELARERFELLRSEGLRAVLISASLFHNEFIPFRQTRMAIDVAMEVFNGQVLVWTQSVYNLLGRLDESRTHSLKEWMEELGCGMDGMWKIHNYLTPCGKAAETLSEGMRRYSPEEINSPCASVLERTGHFHIDPCGNLFTGSCPGISVASVETGLHPDIDPEEFPAYHILWTQGPLGLVKRGGCEVREDGYMGKCEMCLDLRKQLVAGGKYKEFTPKDFYA